MNASQAKKISLFDLMNHLGYYPQETRNSGNEVWYNSPFRQEEKPSFKIKLDQNIWYDFGEGAGGNILDFVMRLKSVDLSGSLSFLENTHLQRAKNPFKPLSKTENQTDDLFKTTKHEIIEIKPVYHYALKEYIKERCIDPAIAYNHLREIKYKINDKEYFTLGFANRAGGWEVRSSIFKGCLGEKDISVFETSSKKVSVFEGFMDYLSFLTIHKNEKLECDVIVLNSNSFKTKAISFIQSKEYNEVHTYFDNDKSGEGALKTFKEKLKGITIIPQNHLYENFIDLNDFLKGGVNKGTKKVRII